VSLHNTEPVRRSIEVEYWVVDDDGRLTTPGGLVDASPGVEREFVEPLLEIKTTPCESTAQLRRELVERIGAVLQRAEGVGKHLVPLATPLYDGEIEELEGDRTRIQNHVVGDAFGYVRHCAGTHIHVEQRSGQEIDQLNALIALDPALALVNSSPCFGRRYLAAGARSKLYRWMAYDDLPHQGRLWSYIDERAEWTRRLERRYEEFVQAGLDAGVDRQAIEANFDPESAVWTPVQFREAFGTVEWRSPDAAVPSQVVQLADGIADIIGHIDDAAVRVEGTEGRRTDEELVLPEFSAVIGYVDDAIRDGLADRGVRSYLDRMGFDVAAYDPVTRDIAVESPLTSDGVRQLRLAHAERLERDVRQTRPVGSS
jgi:hypothetical protein